MRERNVAAKAATRKACVAKRREVKADGAMTRNVTPKGVTHKPIRE